MSRWVRLASGLTLGAAVAAAWGFWWGARPARHLAEAGRLVGAGEPLEAVDWLDLPERTPATRDRALVLRARAALGVGRPRDAVGPLNRVDPRGPWAAEADFWKGRTLFQAGNPKGAVAWFRRALQRRPDHVESLRWLAAAAYDLGDWRAAVAALETLTRIKPGDAAAWRTLGLLFQEDGKPDRAGRAYEASLRHDPGQPAVRLELAEVLLKQAKTGDAERQLAACRGRVPEGRRLELLARCRKLGGDVDETRALLEAGLVRFPRHPGLLSQRAALALGEGRADQAAPLLDRALAEEPDNPDCLYLRGLALRRLGKAAEGDRDLARAAEIKRGVAEMATLNIRATDRPDDPQVRHRLARVCARLGKPELAAYWTRAALACEAAPPGDPETPAPR